MGEGNTLRVTAADRPYGEFYDFYSVSPENFGYTLVPYYESKSMQETTQCTTSFIFVHFVNVPKKGLFQ